ncbi:glycosyltransferase family 4 protein [Flavobacterium sp. LB2P74]|uniref:glycosyltransferase family 4 protein n=1 Tax=Flavobacterium sp. LB2P74 TaxID=3401717 RepID=UPI003AB0020F
MKILVIGPMPNPINGCSYANFILCRNLNLRGYDYDVMNTSTKSISSKQGSSFSLKKGFSFLALYGFIHKIFSATHIYFTPGQTFYGIVKYSPFFLICILLGKPYVIHVHGNHLGTEFKELRGIKRNIFKYLISNASIGIVLSESLRSNFDGLLISSKVFVVENFVENGIYSSMDNVVKLNDKPRIVYLSNLMKEKGILELLDALIILKNKNIDFEAFIAGAIELDIEKEVHEKLLVLNNNVKYLGSVSGSNKYKILKQSNIFILPTYYKMEGQPISILEALATGNIVVTTAHGGIPDVISIKNGFFVVPKSALSIADCVEKIAKDLAVNVEEFSTTNMAYAKKCFTEKIFTDKILTFFH